MTQISRTVFLFGLGCALGAFRAGAEPSPRGEILRLSQMTEVIGGESGQFWAVTPKDVLLLEGTQIKRQLRAGTAFQGQPATFATTTHGWLLGTSEGIWEARANDQDFRHLPEMEADGVFRFDQSVAFTDKSVFRLATPYERYEYREFTFDQLEDSWDRGDTLLIATEVGLRRLLWEERRWDDAPLGEQVETEHLVRFLRPATFNEIDVPDSALTVDAFPLVAGERYLYYEDPNTTQWRPVEGLRFPRFTDARSDSLYRRVDAVMFQDAAGASGDAPAWRRWVVMPTGVARVSLPTRDVPQVTGQWPLLGDTRDTYRDGDFVWVATSQDLFVIDREFQNVEAFLAEENMFIWGFLGEPTEFRTPVNDERGWYCLSPEGMTEVFTESWSWDAYGTDRFVVHDVTDSAPDVDGFWVGTTKGLRWFNAVRRRWDKDTVPRELSNVPIRRLEWRGNDLFALTDTGIHASTRHARRWVRVASF